MADSLGQALKRVAQNSDFSTVQASVCLREVSDLANYVADARRQLDAGPGGGRRIAVSEGCARR